VSETARGSGLVPEPQVSSLAVLRDPYGRTAEAFGVLKSRLEFARLEHDFKSLLLTSARPYPAKSAVAANLAVALAQAGRRVLLCDLDSRRTSVTSLFGLGERPGVTEVALGHRTPEEAIVAIPGSALIASPPIVHERLAVGDADAGGLSLTPGVRGELKVLPFGGVPPHSGFLGTRAVAELLETLRYARADLVLIDAPPLLASGEAQTLGALADALIVALADPARPAVLADLAATLSRLPARPLGFITVGVPRERAESPSVGRGGRVDPAGGEVTPLTPSNGHGRERASAARYTTVRGSGDPT
jgi:non-specific protein-tyrosine kinase